MGGIGKTELALQYSHFHLKQKTYKGGICWLDCRGENVGLQIVGFTNSQFNLQIPEECDWLCCMKVAIAISLLGRS